MINKGIAFCVGIGPGDPELMTLKAVRLIRENDVIAVPGQVPQKSTAYQIAAAAVPELTAKELVPIPMPMVQDPVQLHAAHEQGVRQLESYLDQGRNVVYLTLGDSSIYCSFHYLQRILEADGYPVQYISGVPSFCAAAAALKIPLAESDESLHIIPALYQTEPVFESSGNYVLMKSGRHLRKCKELLRSTGMEIQAVENCGMAQERCFHSLEEIPDDAGYFTLLIARGSRK